MKGGSATLANREGHVAAGKKLRWAKGYDIESVSPRTVNKVRRYVRLQPVRHPAEAIEAWIPGGNLNDAALSG
jgi:hypothetical protein